MFGEVVGFEFWFAFDEVEGSIGGWTKQTGDLSIGWGNIGGCQYACWLRMIGTWPAVWNAGYAYELVDPPT